MSEGENTNAELDEQLSLLLMSVQSGNVGAFRSEGSSFMASFQKYLDLTKEGMRRLGALAKAGLWLATQEHERAEQLFQTNRLMIGVTSEACDVIAVSVKHMFT